MSRALQIEVQQLLKSKVDKKYLEKIRELVPSQFPILGVRVPEIRALIRPFQANHKALDFQSVCKLVDLQFESHCREEMLFGIFLLIRFKKNFSSALWQKIDSWIEYIDNWEVCDQLAMNVAGEILANDLSLLNQAAKWTKSSQVWRRRFAVASVTVLNQKGRQFTDETIRICKPLLNDEVNTVQTAVGWALREVCKHNSKAVYDLLFANRKKMNPKILRESSQKLSASQRKTLLGQ
jgi:3-methyladenine DNA glycosylase AlkD